MTPEGVAELPEAGSRLWVRVTFARALRRPRLGYRSILHLGSVFSD
jgi:hypothetical protein